MCEIFLSTCCECPSSNKKFSLKVILGKKKCVFYCTGLVPLLIHFLSQLVRSAKARLKTLDAEADHETSFSAHSALLSSCNVIPSSSLEVR